MSLNLNTVVYLAYQAKGQFHILMNRQKVDEFKIENTLKENQLYNLNLISEIKRYSVDSLSYKFTSNFTKIYNQKNNSVLWVISASEKYKIQPYYWNFPLVGKVSYKGFFDKKKAEAEKNRLICLGYDVDFRSVSAWSTLGWFSDPILSNMLDRSKGSLCNLIFHELFHATYFAPSSVEYNENLASFIAHKATLQFLKSDTLELQKYISNYRDNEIIDKTLASIVKDMQLFFEGISNKSEVEKSNLKFQKLNEIYKNLKALPVKSTYKTEAITKQISISKNAWFVDFEQYNSLQDSLEIIFNKNYKSNLSKMVQSLK